DHTGSVSGVKFLVDADVGKVAPESHTAGVHIMTCNDAGRMFQPVLERIGIVGTDEDLAMREVGGRVEMIGQDGKCRLLAEIQHPRRRLVVRQPAAELIPIWGSGKIAVNLPQARIERYVLGATMFVEAFQERTGIST